MKRVPMPVDFHRRQSAWAITMTAQIFQFPTPRSNDLMRRMDSLSRDALHLYQAALVLALSAVELQLAIMGFHDRTRL